MMPPFTIGPRSIPCVHERVWIRDPRGAQIRPAGMATKLAVNFMDGQPVSASVRMDYGVQTVVQLDWITDPPRYEDVAPGVVVAFPMHRVRRAAPSVPEIA